ncbi:hypothetical protein C8Q76DRAFT_245256 [Earliella scabrosa]|nr:hypothetical protein C8Q76DRAFT_245256 [Earliella scabrosa]
MRSPGVLCPRLLLPAHFRTDSDRYERSNRASTIRRLRISKHQLSTFDEPVFRFPVDIDIPRGTWMKMAEPKSRSMAKVSPSAGRVSESLNPKSSITTVTVLSTHVSGTNSDTTTSWVGRQTTRSGPFSPLPGTCLSRELNCAPRGQRQRRSFSSGGRARPEPWRATRARTRARGPALHMLHKPNAQTRTTDSARCDLGRVDGDDHSSGGVSPSGTCRQRRGRGPGEHLACLVSQRPAPVSGYEVVQLDESLSAIQTHRVPCFVSTTYTYNSE